MNILRSLTHRLFALLWTGQTISRLGTMALASLGLLHPAIRNPD